MDSMECEEKTEDEDDGESKEGENASKEETKQSRKTRTRRGVGNRDGRRLRAGPNECNKYSSLGPGSEERRRLC